MSYSAGQAHMYIEKKLVNPFWLRFAFRTCFSSIIYAACSSLLIIKAIKDDDQVEEEEHETFRLGSR